jgi:Rod binding domain-containing protein
MQIGISQNVGPGSETPVEQRRVADAAREFEALLISQLLRSARQSDSGGWLGSGEDDSAAPALEYGEEQLAAALSARGGLGLAHIVVQTLGD